MTKRHCHSCGHYQDSGSDKVGWCNNPRRKIASDIRLYVRAAELPCRDSWDHDLWEDKEGFAPRAGVVLNNTVGPLAPASIDDLVFLASNQRQPADGETAEPSPASAVDRVIREESAGAASADGAPHSVRGSVRRAHQHLLADKRTERFADGAAPAFDGGFSVPAASRPGPDPNRSSSEHVYEPMKDATDYAATRPSFSAPPPVQPHEMDRSMPKIAIYPGEDDRFLSVPRRVDDVPLPKASRTGRNSEIQPSQAEQGGGETQSAFTGRPARFERSITVPRRNSDQSQPIEATAVEARRRIVEAEPEHVAVNEAPEELIDDEFLINQAALVSRPRHRVGGLFGSRRRPVVEPMHEIDEAWDDEQPIVEQAPVFSAPAPRMPEIRVEPAVVVASPEPVNDSFSVSLAKETALWTNVPRMCRTCRDFRPAESGERGWCNNKWAFNHRRMVDADERPCDSSVGCWWLPHDDVWLASSDISAHGQPTPLLDLWLGQRRSRDSDPESASIGRRKRG